MIFNSLLPNAMKQENYHHLALARHYNPDHSLSDEADDSLTSGHHPKKQRTVDASNDGATIEAARRPRGRPPGSKNKPKPPVIIETDPSSAMRPHVLEVRAGHDVIDALARFSARRGLGLCVLAGTGAVADVTFRHPGGGAAVGFRGRFEVLSISATFLPPSLSAATASAPASVSVSLAGPQGRVVGGTVTGLLVAAGTVTLVAAAFENPTFHRLPEAEAEEEVSVEVTVSGGGADVDAAAGQPEQEDHEGGPHVGSHRHHHHQYERDPHVETCGMSSMYSSHLPSPDVIWAPTARPRPPPY